MSATASPVSSEQSSASARTMRRIVGPFASLTRPRAPRVKFGVPLADALKDDQLPAPIVDMMVYIAQEGVTTTDLFRRNGNPTDLKMIIRRMSEGKEIHYSNYNFYTLASVIKKFLLKIPGGVFGPNVEHELLEVLELDNRMRQYDAIHSILSSLPEASQQLLALLFGTWFRIVNHSEYNTMSSEAVAKSVAPSLFHTCADSPQKVEQAVQVLQILIDDFGVANMFGRKNIQYFADMTRTGINVREKYRYEFRYPGGDDSAPLEEYLQLFSRLLQAEAKMRGFDPVRDAITEDEFYGSPVAPSRGRADTKGSQGSSTVEIRLPPSSSPPSPQSLQTSGPADSDYNPHKKLTHVSSLSAPEVNQGCSSPVPDSSLAASKRMYLSTSLSRFDHVRRRQMLRLKKRSNWFLSPNTSTSMDSESVLGSREHSVGGKSSMEGTSSDALASDVTASDGQLSDTPHSDGLRLSSDIDCSYEESTGCGGSPAALHTPTLTPIRGHQPLQRLAHMQQHRHHQDILNANHRGTSTPKRAIGDDGEEQDNGFHPPSIPASQEEREHEASLAMGAAASLTLTHPPTQGLIIQQQQQQEAAGPDSRGGASTPHHHDHHLQRLQQQQQQQQQHSSHMPSTQVTPAGPVSESEVRFFMVESYYGTPTQNGES